MGLAEWAYSLAGAMLAEALPRRWAHSLGVARRTRELEPILGTDAELMVAAAVLHDVGYSPSIATTGFHPFDGARFLRERENAGERVIRLVAHHSCALLEAEKRGLRDALEREFAVERPELVDALIFCDMTTTPDGERTQPASRLAEISKRYGPGGIVTQFIHSAGPEIHAASARVEQRMAMAVSGQPKGGCGSVDGARAVPAAAPNVAVSRPTPRCRRTEPVRSPGAAMLVAGGRRQDRLPGFSQQGSHSK